MPFEEKENKQRLSVLDEFSNKDSDYHASEVSSNLSCDQKMEEHYSNELDNLLLANLTKDDDSNKSSDYMIANKLVKLLKSKESSAKQSTPSSNKK